MDIRKLFIATNQALTEAVRQITPEQLAVVVPGHMRYADGQTLRATVNILAYENFCVPKILSGEAGLAVNKDFGEDLLQGDFINNYVRLSDQANAAAGACADLEKTVHISYGDFPASGYLSDISIQRSTSAFDVAELIGVTIDLPEDAVKGLWEIVTPYADYLRESGIFPPEVKVSEDATLQDKLQAFTGRQPRDRSVVV